MADGTGTETIEQLIFPTPQRLAKEGHEFEAPEVGRHTERRAWRMVPVVETMRRMGKICDDRWAAWERFEADWRKTEINPSVIMGYGSRAGGGGTPADQLHSLAFELEVAKEQVRSFAVARLTAALAAIDVHRIRCALTMAVGSDCSLESIGAAISRYQLAGVRRAIATTAIEDGLWILHRHYQNLHAQNSKRPRAT